jgi:hypothetical protein
MDQKHEKWKPQFVWLGWYKPVAKAIAIALDKALREQFNFTELEKLLTN